MKLHIASVGLAAGLILHLCGQNVQAALAGTTYNIAEIQGSSSVVQDVWVFSSTGNMVTGNTSAGTYTMVVDLGAIAVWNATLTDNTTPSNTITVTGIQFSNFIVGFGQTGGSGGSGGSGDDGGDGGDGGDNGDDIASNDGGNGQGGGSSFFLIGQQQ